MDIERLKQAGFSDEEIKQSGVDVKVTPEESTQVKKLANAGFSESEILNHFQNARKQNPIVAPAKASKDIPLSSVPLTAVTNIPSSGYEFGKNLIQPIMHPIETGKNLLGILKGAVGAGDNSDSQKWDAVKQAIIERYGGYENIKRTIANDPVGSLADVSTILTGGGTLVSKVPQISKLGTIAKTVGNTIEPLSLASKPIEYAGKGAGTILSGTAGFTTGAGGESVRQAFRAGKEKIPAFKEAMGEPVVNLQTNAKSALQTIKDGMKRDYVDRLDKLKTNTTQLDINPVKANLGQLQKDYNITRNSKGEFDFSRSTLDRNSYTDVENIIKTVEDWGNAPGDLTPRGMDILKRKLDDFYSENKNSRGFVTSLKNTVKDTIGGQVPEYKTMLGNYEKTSSQIDEIEKALSLGKKSGADTAIRKLLTSLKENNEFRGTLIKQLDEANGGSLSSQLAAHNLKSWTPTSFMGKAVDIAAISGLMYALSPKLGVGVAMASPKVVGELAYTLGKLAKQYENVKKITPPAGARQALTQTGRYGQSKEDLKRQIIGK